MLTLAGSFLYFVVETDLMIAYFSKEAEQAVEFHIKHEQYEISQWT